MKPVVSVVIVTWNSGDFLEPCLRSLIRSFNGLDAGAWLVVVDNGSIDGSAEVVERVCSRARVIRNTRNVGFAAACNQGIAATDTPFVAMLNPDTVVEPQWLTEALRVLRQDQNAAACAVQIRYRSRPDLVNSAGIAVDRTGLARDRLGGQDVSMSETRPVNVFGASGGAALYRRTALDQVGGFEESFFAYLEDADFAWRARRMGWVFIYAPGSIVFHHYSRSFGPRSGRKSFLLSRNRVWLLLRNASGPQLIRGLPAFAAYQVGAAIVGLARDRSIGGLIGPWAALGGVHHSLRVRSTAPFLPYRNLGRGRSMLRVLRERLARDQFLDSSD